MCPCSYGFVFFERAEDCKKALTAGQGAKLQGNTLIVNYSKKRKEEPAKDKAVTKKRKASDESEANDIKTQAKKKASQEKGTLWWKILLYSELKKLDAGYTE